MIVPFTITTPLLLASATAHTTTLGEFLAILRHGSRTQDLQQADRVMGELRNLFTATGHPRFSREALEVRMEINRAVNRLADKSAVLQMANDYCRKLLMEKYRETLEEIAEHEDGKRLLFPDPNRIQSAT